MCGGVPASVALTTGQGCSGELRWAGLPARVTYAQGVGSPHPPCPPGGGLGVALALLTPVLSCPRRTLPPVAVPTYEEAMRCPPADPDRGGRPEGRCAPPTRSPGGTA